MNSAPPEVGAAGRRRAPGYAPQASAALRRPTRRPGARAGPSAARPHAPRGAACAAPCAAPPRPRRAGPAPRPRRARRARRRRRHLRRSQRRPLLRRCSRQRRPEQARRPRRRRRCRAAPPSERRLLALQAAHRGCCLQAPAGLPAAALAPRLCWPAASTARGAAAGMQRRQVPPRPRPLQRPPRPALPGSRQRQAQHPPAASPPPQALRQYRQQQRRERLWPAARCWQAARCQRARLQRPLALPGRRRHAALKFPRPATSHLTTSHLLPVQPHTLCHSRLSLERARGR